LSNILQIRETGFTSRAPLLKNHSFKRPISTFKSCRRTLV
jgi:hypothetical protein